MNTLNLISFSKTVGFVAGVAVIANILLMLVGRSISDVPAGFGPYEYGSITMLTLVGVIGAAVVYAVMHAWYADVAKVNKHFTVLSVVILITSFYPDVMLPYSSDLDQVGWNYVAMGILMLMHVVAAVLVVHFFTKKASHPL